jgi:hypothetical protein
MALPASAGAATTTVGPPLGGANFSDLTPGAPGKATGLNILLGVPAARITSPVDGTIIGGQIMNPSGSFSLQVVRGTIPTPWTGMATGPLQELTASGVTAFAPVSLPISTGDFVGLNFEAGASVAQSPGGGSSRGFQPPLTTGVTGDGNAVPGMYGYNATVRYCIVPDLLKKKEATARAAATAADCTIGTVTKPKKKKKRKKAKFVKRQSVPAGTQISDTAPINLTMGKKPKKKKKGKKS